MWIFSLVSASFVVKIIGPDIINLSKAHNQINV